MRCFIVGTLTLFDLKSIRFNNIYAVYFRNETLVLYALMFFVMYSFMYVLL